MDSSVIWAPLICLIVTISSSPAAPTHDCLTRHFIKCCAESSAGRRPSQRLYTYIGRLIEHTLWWDLKIQSGWSGGGLLLTLPPHGFISSSSSLSCLLSPLSSLLSCTFSLFNIYNLVTLLFPALPAHLNAPHPHPSPVCVIRYGSSV